MRSQHIDLSGLRSRLSTWLEKKMPGATSLSITDMAHAGAGFTNVSIPFTLSWREAGRRRTRGLLFRAPGTSDPVYPDPKLDRQFRVMQCLQDTRVPVPRTYWMEDDERVLGFPFYVMSRIDGVVPSEYPPYHSFGCCYDASPEQRARMWWGTLEAMAEVHALDWRQLGLSFLGVPPGGTGPLDQELSYWEHFLRWAQEEEQLILATAMGWLRQNRYAPGRVTLCWGDARLPNTIFSSAGEVLGLLDWDMAVIADPVSDLAFIVTLDWLLSEGTGVPRLEGFPGTEETVARYEELTGHRVEHFFYNEVFATLRAGVVILRVQKNLQRLGVDLPGENPIVDNFCTRRLAALLGLPAPASSGEAIVRAQDLRGTVQLHLTGTGGGTWHIVVESGRLTRHAGAAKHPDATLTISAEDWAALQRGELNPFRGWTSGRLTVTGDHALYQQLVDVIMKVQLGAPGAASRRP